MKAYGQTHGCVHAPGLDDVREFLPFVQRIAQRIARRLPSHVRIDELVGAGLVGLVEARQRFDASRTTDFHKFAEFRVKGAILDELRRRDLMPRDARIAAKRIQGRMAALTNALGREPQEEEIALDLGLTLEELRATLEKLTPVRVVGFDDDGDHDGDAADLTSNQRNPFDEMERRELLTALSAAIGKLSQRHQQVLYLYYQEELTMREIGEVLQVTESRVCQMVSEATLKLRAWLNPRRGEAAGGEPRKRRAEGGGNG